MALGENTRFIVTSLPGLDAGMLYEDIYCARGQAENYVKHLKDDLAADRTSCTCFRANCMRLQLHAAIARDIAIAAEDVSCRRAGAVVAVYETLWLAVACHDPVDTAVGDQGVDRPV